MPPSCWHVNKEKEAGMTETESFLAHTSAAPETRPFWEAARQHRFVLPVCRACGKAHWYPRLVCPLCNAHEIDWRDASGLGSVYSLSVARRASPPYALAYVTVDEGPTLLTNIVGAEFDSIEIGMRVRVVFRDQEGALPAPTFTPVR